MPKKEITIDEIAEHLGVSKPRVYQMRKRENMPWPVSSLDQIDKWRRDQGLRREATNAGGGRCKSAPSDEPARKLQVRKLERTGDSLADALNAAILAHEGAFDDYEHARVHGLSTRSARLSEHNKALQGRLNAETAYREEMERRKVLVNKQQVTEQSRRCLDSVLRRLKKLAQEVGPQCNPQDPINATALLQKKVDEILKAGHDALLQLQS